MPEYDKIVEEALILYSEHRARLAERLLASLDGLPVENTEQLWVEEAQRRLASLRQDGSQTVSSDELARKAERLFR
jgi:hypothetical protein